MTKFHFITRCSRLDNLPIVGNSIFSQQSDKSDITWHILFDTSKVAQIPIDILNYLNSINTKLYYVENVGNYLHGEISKVIESIDDGYIHVIDDDNILHEDYIRVITDNIIKDARPLIYVYEQKVAGKDFTGLDVRKVGPEYMKVSKIDLAQVTFHRSLITESIPEEYIGDGILIEKMYSESPDNFKFIHQILCYYNFLSINSGEPTYHLPRILVVGEDNLELTTAEITDFWETRLNIKSILTDGNITDELVNFNPDAIISVGDSFTKFEVLNNKPLDVRRRWVHLDKLSGNTGDVAYDVSMNSMLLNDTSNLISFFTPTYNTGNRLYKTYQSLVEQTYNNWEWIIVDDSNDNGVTYSIAKKISRIDERVKVYKFTERSGGIIGESKYRAASLCSGEILAELDHDDILLERTAEYLNIAQKAHPDVGFFYTDCIEVDENYNSLTYGEGFAFGYGSYYDYTWRDKNYKVAKECDINPKTIRHIVSVPNHIRAWRRSVYHSIGGHNRRLSIADDYELVVRTFLYTKMCRIPYPGYIQFIYDNNQGTNTHNATRKDIQRRVWSIANYYNLQIKNRFEELGMVDWAYEESPNSPLNAENKYGEQEGYVNLTYNIEK